MSELVITYKKGTQVIEHPSGVKSVYNEGNIRKLRDYLLEQQNALNSMIADCQNSIELIQASETP
jgi:hypothetical protein